MGAAASVGGQWNLSDIDRIRSVLREIDDDKLTSLEEAKRQISRLRRILQERVEKREEEAHNGSITFSEFLAATEVSSFQSTHAHSISFPITLFSIINESVFSNK